MFKEEVEEFISRCLESKPLLKLYFGKTSLKCNSENARARGPSVCSLSDQKADQDEPKNSS